MKAIFMKLYKKCLSLETMLFELGVLITKEISNLFHRIDGHRYI